MAHDFSSQLKTLDILRWYIGKRGYSPTFQELADLRGLSEMAVRRHVRQLIQRGHLRQSTPRTWRNIRLIERAA